MLKVIVALDRFIMSRQVIVLPAVAGLMFSAFVTTVNPTVTFVDSGELAAVSMMLGVAHPTGYPLFTVLGRLVGMLAPGEPVAALNLFSSALVACAVGIFCAILIEIARLPLFRFAGEQNGKGIAAVIGSMAFGFSTTVWAQSVAVEVYSLHLFLILLFLFLFLSGLSETLAGAPSRIFLLAFFLLGLGFANHMTTILLIPASAYLYFAAFGLNRGALKGLMRKFPFFLLGLSFYGFLPVRSSSQPVLDWGHPADTQRLLWHVSGKQYTSWIFSGFESAEKQFTYFLTNYPEVFSWAAIVFTLLGAMIAFSGGRRLFWFAGLLVTGCLAYSINYDIHDIDSYFLLAYAGAGLFMTWGIQALIGRMIAWRWETVVVGIVLLPVYEFTSHRPAVDESENFLVHDYTMNILNSLDSSAVVFSFQWDYFVSAAYYFQHVKKVRPDVVVIDKELLRRSWYFLQLERMAPWLLERSRSSVNAYLVELHKFEHGLPYQGAVIEERFNGMINAMVAGAIADRPVYFGAEMEPQFAPGAERVPEGLLLRLRKPGEAVRLPDFTYVFRETGFRSRLTGGMRIQYAKMFTLRAIWLKTRQSDDEGAREWLRKALLIDPSFSPALRFLQELGG